LWHGGNLVCLVYLVDLVHLVSFVQPNKRDKPNKPNNDLRMLADFFSILLCFGFAVIQMSVLPVEPSMAKFVGKNVAPSGYGQALAKVDGLCCVIPDTIGIRVPTVHVGIGKLTHGDPIAERKHDS
jgi:hypothetical protein